MNAGYAVAAPLALRARARDLRTLRRSRSLKPPHIPNFSPFARAYSKQSSRTTQPRHTSLASRVDAPRSGKKSSGSTPMQFALLCQVGTSDCKLPIPRTTGNTFFHKSWLSAQPLAHFQTVENYLQKLQRNKTRRIHLTDSNKW
jgi:hypothetical protein